MQRGTEYWTASVGGHQGTVLALGLRAGQGCITSFHDRRDINWDIIFRLWQDLGTSSLAESFLAGLLANRRAPSKSMAVRLTQLSDLMMVLRIRNAGVGQAKPSVLPRFGISSQLPPCNPTTLLSADATCLQALTVNSVGSSGLQNSLGMKPMIEAVQSCSISSAPSL